MKRRLIACLAMAASGALYASALRADHAPYYLPDGTVVIGDWGLYRPGHIAPWAEGPYVIGAPFYAPRYFPSNRHDPGAYRRRPPVDAAPIPPEPYYRSWGTQSPSFNPAEATIYSPFAPPEVIYAPTPEQRDAQRPRRPGRNR